MKIFFDGGLRPAPAGMELAVVAGGRSHVERELGPGTSMEAEWLALIAAMRLAGQLELPDAVLLGDAAAVIDQANRRVKVPRVHLQHFQAFLALPRPPRFRLRHIRRTQNLAGIVLSKR
ncbi:reverse transcriptase-like protein [Sphingomonas sp. IC4-52]|uniref:reverse transcriptase-like protein n=1 Tax=Sphingomonas sp. IC4-52 TaxID=2887202 RepID=UPI001D0FCBD9|nr:reverse transcriptase-like protein [Sphingomonas sp. IC4-52]MCC2981400.1 reverse transcriptase-like protein [Sphingomonas sp. IC4-52]